MRTHIIQTNFTAGEVSPRLLGRVDIQRYANACKTAENVNVVIQGGVRRRDGLRYVYESKSVKNTDGSLKPIRLIPWVFSREESYILEMGDNYIRFYQNGRIVLKDPNDASSDPYEIATTITADLLQDLSYAQGADTMYFAHIKHKPARLVRHGQLDWRWEDIDWSNAANTMPFAENPDHLSPDCWLAPIKTGDKGQFLVGSIITLRMQKSDIDTAAPTNGAAFTAADVGKYVRINGGVVKITAFTDAHNVQGEITSLMYGDATNSNLVASPNSWTLEEGVWSDAKGWPGCVAFHQQRLIFAGSKLYPQTIWGSAIRQYLNFELGYVDDAAYSFTLDSDQVNPITALFSLNSLIALTHSSEFIISGTNNVINATSVSVRVPSNYGASYVRPMRVGTELVFIQRAGRKVLSMSYDPDSQTAYSVSDLSVLAEHMTESLIVDSSYQQEPESFIHFITGDGEMITLTYNKENEVTGWTRSNTGYVSWTTEEPDPDYPNDTTKHIDVLHERQDAFKNIASIPTLSGVDDCYVAVERTINGVQRLYIERFATGLNVDSALVGQVSNQATGGLKDWTALNHLEGCTVDIVADGVPLPQQEVKTGKVTLQQPAELVNIGLPFYSKIVTLKPEFQTPSGTPQGAHNSTSKVRVRLLDTVGMTINGDTVPFRNFGKYILNKPTPLFTGDMEWQLIGWDNQEITIEQRQPLPFHMLAVIRTINVN
ncbi:hypothetical protein [Enterobacter bugandensis]|uniref:hypothetical protein n=1 Tax=Enterobacter bugandensis TaxID=881260 RepID=UPI002005C6FA|nr:hypothetical protein [Enterobacter bugandensis]MCK7435901.1 hypothetical protein [Enterobacter bugandensis]